MGRSRPERVKPGGVAALGCAETAFKDGDALILTGEGKETWSGTERVWGECAEEGGGEEDRREGEMERVGDGICTGSGVTFTWIGLGEDERPRRSMGEFDRSRLLAEDEEVLVSCKKRFGEPSFSCTWLKFPVVDGAAVVVVVVFEDERGGARTICAQVPL